MQNRSEGRKGHFGENVKGRNKLDYKKKTSKALFWTVSSVNKVKKGKGQTNLRGTCRIQSEC